MIRQIITAGKIVITACICIISLVFIYFIFAFAGSHIPVNNHRLPSSDYTIYLLSNGVHVDLVVPVKTPLKDWSQTIKYAHTTGNDTLAAWVGFGWGDKGFYLQTPTWADLKFSVAFRAITGLSTSAMHVTFRHELKEDKQCRRIPISKDEYRRLNEFILAGFEKTPAGDVKLIITNANYGSNDAFYEGTGTYSLFYTCNTWTNNALKYAGLNAGRWTPFESGVLYHYRDR